LRFRILEGGLLQPAPSEGEPSLRVRVKPDAPAAWLKGEEHFLRAIEVSGNARLAEEVRVLARSLRWDYEEDLSRVVGDVAAHRLAGAARDFVAWTADTARRLGEMLADYAAEEKKLVIRRGELDEHAQALARLRDDLERLAQRVNRLG
jgi:ubiquinone biosynthesis accessory factor UbiJ